MSARRYHAPTPAALAAVLAGQPVGSPIDTGGEPYRLACELVMLHGYPLRLPTPPVEPGQRPPAVPSREDYLAARAVAGRRPSLDAGLALLDMLAERNRERRQQLLAVAAAKLGQPAAEAIEAQLRALWPLVWRAQGAAEPQLPRAEGPHVAPRSGSPTLGGAIGPAYQGGRGDGSFLSPSHGGPLRRDECVGSGGAVR